MKNKWLLCILLMLFLPFGLFAQVAPPLEKQKAETQEAPENNNEVTTNSDTNTDGDAGKTIKGVINDEQGETIIGASVIIKGEDTGTTSDMDGSHSACADGVCAGERRKFSRSCGSGPGVFF